VTADWAKEAVHRRWQRGGSTNAGIWPAGGAQRTAGSAGRSGRGSPYEAQTLREAALELFSLTRLCPLVGLDGAAASVVESAIRRVI